MRESEAVVARWSKAAAQGRANGLRCTIPVTTDMRDVDGRAAEAMSAAAADRLPIGVEVPVDRRMTAASVMQVFVDYGTPEPFVPNILAPGFRRIAQAGTSRFDAADLIRDRAAAAPGMQRRFAEALKVGSIAEAAPRAACIVPPDQHGTAAPAREKAREAAAREQVRLRDAEDVDAGRAARGMRGRMARAVPA